MSKLYRDNKGKFISEKEYQALKDSEVKETDSIFIFNNRYEVTTDNRVFSHIGGNKKEIGKKAKLVVLCDPEGKKHFHSLANIYEVVKSKYVENDSEYRYKSISKADAALNILEDKYVFAKVVDRYVPVTKNTFKLHKEFYLKEKIYVFEARNLTHENVRAVLDSIYKTDYNVKENINYKLLIVEEVNDEKDC